MVQQSFLTAPAGVRRKRTAAMRKNKKVAKTVTLPTAVTLLQGFVYQVTMINGATITFTFVAGQKVR